MGWVMVRHLAGPAGRNCSPRAARGLSTGSGQPAGGTAHPIHAGARGRGTGRRTEFHQALPADPEHPSLPQASPSVLPTHRTCCNFHAAKPGKEKPHVPLLPGWKPRPGSAVNYEARSRAGRFPEARLWESALGNPLGRHLRAQCGRFCALGALLLHATWNLPAFTGFAVALGQGRCYLGLNILIQIKKKKIPTPSAQEMGLISLSLSRTTASGFRELWAAGNSSGVTRQPPASRGPPLPSPSHHPGQGQALPEGPAGQRAAVESGRAG